MTSKRDLRRLLGPVRDFACAFALFFGMAYVLVADKTYPFPPAMLSLMSGGAIHDGVPTFRAWGEIGPSLAASHGAADLSAPFGLALLAVVFSAIVTLNLAILRHLRRVHASSRRGAWREG